MTAPDREVPVAAPSDTAPTETPSEPTSDKKRSRADTRAPTQQQITDTAVNFAGTNFIIDSVVGTSRSDRPARAVTGKVRESDVGTMLEHFVPPPSYDEAVARLQADRVVVLEGTAGCGRHTGAVALLREFTDGPLVALSPTITLQELAERSYQQGYGYVVLGRRNESQSAASSFDWMTVRDQVCEAGAYLVVTGTSSTGRRSAAESGQVVTWQRPAAGVVLRAHLDTATRDDNELDQLLKQLEAKVSDELSVAELVQLVRRIARADDPEQALGSVDEASGALVRSWFDHHGDDMDAVLDVTALTFLNGAHDRTFESLRRRLAQLMEHQLAPGRTVEPSQDPPALPAHRVTRFGPESLICARRVQGANGSRRALVFRAAAHRKHVLAELWERYEIPFWNGVRAWLWELVADLDDDSTDGLDNVGVVAHGLALLADVDFEEVSTSYLEDWSAGELGWIGQTAATYVLWLMCYRDGLEAVALDTASRWARNGTPSQRWTAAVAFSDELGVRYPTEAVRRLWHLVVTGADPKATASIALAILFSNLVEAGEDAGVVPGQLERQLDRLDRRRARGRVGDPHLRELTLDCVIHVLTARSGTNDQVAVMAYLHQRPDRADSVARLCATALRHRPWRLRTLRALWAGLQSLKDVSEEPQQDATVLGRALATHLRTEEWQDFTADFRRVDALSKEDRARPLVEALLAALDRLNPPDPPHVEGTS